MFITWRETFSYLRRFGIGPGDRVLVIGNGANGLAFAAHARNLGAASVVIGSAGRAEAAARAGAAAYIDYPDADVAEQLEHRLGSWYNIWTA